MINKSSFDKVLDGKQIGIYTIKNSTGMYADITNYGGKIVTLNAPDKDGQLADVVIGFDTLDEWLAKETYFNTIVGRFANRIKDGRFTLDGKDYQLAVNNGTNALHGGNSGYNQRVWDVVEASESVLKLHYLSPDGEENYPGNLDIVVTYTVTEDNALDIRYEATTDAPTILGFTQHAYFNLKGAGNGDIRDHILMVNADLFTQVDDSFSPDGVVLPVEDHAMDFRQPTLISERIDHEFFVPGRGIDNNFVVRRPQTGDYVHVATLSAAGRTMEVWTTQPGIQIYTGNWVEQNVGKEGKAYDVQCAVCLEAQSIPNSPNLPHFPTTVLRPGEKYDQRCVYKFV